MSRQGGALERTMWAYRLEGPLRMVHHVVPAVEPRDLLPGQVLLRFLAGGICGSDLGLCRHGTPTEDPDRMGYTLHEIVGTVIASTSELEVGQRVVGWASETRGLREIVPTDAGGVVPVPVGLSDAHAVGLQPLACALGAVSRLPDLRGARAAVIGLGPIGLALAHVLSRRGASVVGVDPVDRSDVAAVFGLDEVVPRSSRAWVSSVSSADRFDVVFEAVGHQVGTLDDAIQVTARQGMVVYFGLPDDMYYPLPIGPLMDRNITLRFGTTPAEERQDLLVEAGAHALAHPELLPAYVTHRFPPHQTPAAYRLAALPAVGRLKVVIDASAPNASSQGNDL